MRLFLAIFLPWLQFFTIGRPIAGIFCLVLQLTILGWIPAAIWSVYSLQEYKTNKQFDDLKKQINSSLGNHKGRPCNKRKLNLRQKR